jgi:hypothetical protein
VKQILDDKGNVLAEAQPPSAGDETCASSIRATPT